MYILLGQQDVKGPETPHTVSSSLSPNLLLSFPFPKPESENQSATSDQIIEGRGSCQRPADFLCSFFFFFPKFIANI